jgi:hypothetical protein
MLLPVIYLTFIAAVFHKIAAAITTQLQFDVINFGPAARGTTAHHSVSLTLCTHNNIF